MTSLGFFKYDLEQLLDIGFARLDSIDGHDESQVSVVFEKEVAFCG